MRLITLLFLLILLLSAATVADAKMEYVTIFSDTIKTTYENNQQAVTTASGNVNVSFSDGTITADNLVYDHSTKDLILTGNVAYTSTKQTVKGNKIHINAQSKLWTLDDFFITLQPKIDNNELLEPIFLRGSLIDRTPSGIMTAVDSNVTTCDLVSPHYDITSRKTTLFPGDRLTLDHTSLYYKNRKLYTIPRMVIPLTEKNDLRITPLVGQSDEEGYYVKTTYNYPSRGNQVGYILLDLMSKKGIGQGIDHSYKSTSSSGNLRLYHIYDRSISQDTYEGTVTHNGVLGDFKLNATVDFRSNSYLYASSSKTFSERVSISKSSGNFNTRLSLGRNVNETVSKTTRYSGLFEHSQALSNNLSISGMFDYSGYSTGSYEENRLTSDVSLDYEIPEADFSLTTHRFSDFSESQSGFSSFYGTEKLPEFGIESSTKKLGIDGRPTLLSFSYGKYLELPSVNPVDRAYFSIRLPNSRKQIGSGWAISNAGDFRQYLYSDDTAQYSIYHTLQLERKLNSSSSFSLTHRFQRSNGYTPLRLDYTGRYNSIYASLNMRDSKVHTVSLSSGYDFEDASSGWQDITLRSRYSPSKKFSLYTSTGYDLNLSQWRTVINQLNIKPNNSFSLGIGSRYDTINSRWALVRTAIDTKINPLTRLQLIQSYNGAKKQYDYSVLRVTRDLHCWEASLTYSQQKGFQNTKGIMLNLRLKALPYFPAFGIGQYGESLDTGFLETYE